MKQHEDSAAKMRLIANSFFGKVVLAGILAVGLIGLFPRAAHACSCGGVLTPAEAYQQADVVFVGDVVRVSPPAQLNVFFNSTGLHFYYQFSGGNIPVDYVFQISEIWKGPVTPTITMTSYPNSQCGGGFSFGIRPTTYLIYARLTDGQYMTGDCFRTHVDQASSPDRAFLGPGMAPPSTGVVLPMWVLPLTILLFILMSVIATFTLIRWLGQRSSRR